MKTHTFSIVVGTNACNASCPHCISKMTMSDSPQSHYVNRWRFKIACNIVQQARDGLVNVLLTGKGEPMLFINQITAYLEMMDSAAFPLVDLQTNGTLIRKQEDNLRMWAQHGLTLVCISICHYDPKISNKLMGIKDDFDFWRAADLLHRIGLGVRLNCTMMRDGVWNTAGVEELVRCAKNNGVDQLTVRDVEIPDVVRPEAEGVANYCRTQKMPRTEFWLRDYILRNGGKELLQLPHGAAVYDYKGQNLCASNCVTSTTDPNDIRQVIFFPDGRIAYDWKYKGARIL